jgi:hypothetical protein
MKSTVCNNVVYRLREQGCHFLKIAGIPCPQVDFDKFTDSDSTTLSPKTCHLYCDYENEFSISGIINGCTWHIAEARHNYLSVRSVPIANARTDLFRVFEKADLRLENLSFPDVPLRH